MKNFLTEYNKSYEEICREFKDSFGFIKDKEREWHCNCKWTEITSVSTVQ